MNKRLMETLRKNRKKIKDGTFMDCYNQSVLNGWGGVSRQI